MTSGLRLRRLAAVLAIVAWLLGAVSVFAQATDGFEIELVEIWIRRKVSPERAWDRDLSRFGIAFQLDRQNEDRLRLAGADDAWIAVLRRAKFNPPPATAQRVVAPEVSRRDLRPLYVASETRVTAYVGVLRLRETGGQVRGRALQTSDGPVSLRSTALRRTVPTYGVTVDYASVGLDIEGAFEREIFMLNLGGKYTPFMPLGSSGFRILLGMKPFLGFTRQTLAHLQGSSANAAEPVVDILNATYGGDVSIGVAYSWRPGRSVFAEVGYRATSTFFRELRSPGQANITEGIPWSRWAGNGPLFRLGVGF